MAVFYDSAIEDDDMLTVELAEQRFWLSTIHLKICEAPRALDISIISKGLEVYCR